MPHTENLRRLLQFLPEVPPEDLGLLAGICELKKYKDKDVILKSGNRMKRAFLILEGAVRGFLLNPSGEEKTILLRGRGIFVGDPEGLFTDIPQKLEIVSIGSTEVLLFSFSEFERLALKNKSIQQIYVISLKESVLRLIYRVESMVMMTGEERYLDLLKKNPAFLESSYDKYVASYLGITPVSLSRIKKRINFSELTNDNFIQG